jgi:hypothetical protein
MRKAITESSVAKLCEKFYQVIYLMKAILGKVRDFRSVRLGGPPRE